MQMQKQAVGARLRFLARLANPAATGAELKGLARQLARSVNIGQAAPEELSAVVRRLGAAEDVAAKAPNLLRLRSQADLYDPLDVKRLSGLDPKSIMKTMDRLDALDIHQGLSPAQQAYRRLLHRYHDGYAVKNHEAINRHWRELVQPREDLANQLANSIALSGRHRPRVIHAPQTYSETMPPYPRVWGARPEGSIGKLLGRLGLLRQSPFARSSLAYKGFGGHPVTGMPRLNPDNPGDPMWFSGLRQVSMSYGGDAGGLSYLWRTPVSKLPGRGPFTPHLGLDTRKIMRPRLLQNRQTREIGRQAERHLLEGTRGAGYSDIGNHPLYEMVATPRPADPLSFGALYKKLPSGLGFQQVKG